MAANLQVSVVIDSSFTPLFLGGHHQPRSRDNLFNDNVSCIAFRATSKQFSVDNKVLCSIISTAFVFNFYRKSLAHDGFPSKPSSLPPMKPSPATRGASH